eukprot:SAG11_NODE_696_length_7693_cov_9.962339_8_plen_79_part_00
MQNPTKLELKETPDAGVYVKDLSTIVVKSVQEIDQVFAAGCAPLQWNGSLTVCQYVTAFSHSILLIDNVAGAARRIAR